MKKSGLVSALAVVTVVGLLVAVAWLNGDDDLNSTANRALGTGVKFPNEHNSNVPATSPRTSLMVPQATTSSSIDSAVFSTTKSVPTVASKTSRISSLPLQNNASHLTKEELAQKGSWVAFVASQVEQLANPANAPKPSGANLISGITFLGPDSLAASAVRTVLQLRTYHPLCKLPVEYAHFSHEKLTSNTLKQFADHNITARAFSAPAKYPTAASAWKIVNPHLGVGKPTAILTSPFSRVLFLDPDIMPLESFNPCALLNATTAPALFWPDYRPTTPDRRIWALMGFARATFDREWDSGVALVDKSDDVVRAAIEAAEYLCVQANFYFKHFWGDKEAFRWAFKVLGRELLKAPGGDKDFASDEETGEGLYYSVVKIQPHALGVLEVKPERQGVVENNTGNVTILSQTGEQNDSNFTIPHDKQFCAQNFLQFHPNGAPLFIHMTRLKRYTDSKNYENPARWPFHIAQRYESLDGSSELEFGNTRCAHVKGLAADKCCELGSVDGLRIVTYDFGKSHAWINSRYRELYIAEERNRQNLARQRAFRERQRTHINALEARLHELEGQIIAAGGTVPPSAYADLLPPPSSSAPVSVDEVPALPFGLGTPSPPEAATSIECVECAAERRRTADSRDRLLEAKATAAALQAKNEELRKLLVMQIRSDGNHANLVATGELLHDRCEAGGGCELATLLNSN
ncbi:hypothetical protein HDU84_004547 [Entophlyctis sp. JEL0112]|nr:hypothetical protein HDU84_004547 [Entophlyctis sp. JEL0112]